MPAAGVDALAIVAAALVLLARPPVALTALLGTALLIPTTLVVPYTHFSTMTVQHVVAAALLARVVHARVLRRIDTDAMRAGPALGALAAVIAVAFVVGLVFSVDNAYSIGQTARMVDLGTQVVFLVGCVVLVGQLDAPSRALAIATGLVLVTAGIGFVEHLSNDAWGHWLFSRLPGVDTTNAAQPLDLRQGQPRVRAGSEFALQFAWVSVSLLAAVVVTTVRGTGGRVAACLTAGIVLTAVYWSYSRSALAFGVVVLALVALLVRDSRALSVLLVAVAAVAVAYRLHPSVTTHLSAATDENSISVRLARLDVILNQLAHHPFRGVGLGNLTSTGVRTTDNALLLEFTELGAFGLAALGVLYLVVVAQCARAVAVARAVDRPAAIACLVGAITYVVSAQFYDAFTLIQGPQVLWFLVAVSVIVARRAHAPARLPWPAKELVLAVAAVSVAVAGAFVVTAPSYSTRDYSMTTLPPIRDAAAYDTVVAGKRLMLTACGEATAIVARIPDASIDCAPNIFASGVAEVHLHARSPGQLRVVSQRLVTVIRGRGGIGAMHLRPEAAPVTVREPLWIGAALLVPAGALGLLLLVPWRRRRDASPEPSPSLVALRRRTLAVS